MTIYAVPCASKYRYTDTMFGCLNFASVRASSKNRFNPQRKLPSSPPDFATTELSAARTAKSFGKYSFTATALSNTVSQPK